MAVSSSIGSNLFDVTVGLPLPWLLYTLIFQRDMEVKTIKMEPTWKWQLGFFMLGGSNKYLMGTVQYYFPFSHPLKVLAA